MTGDPTTPTTAASDLIVPPQATEQVEPQVPPVTEAAEAPPVPEAGDEAPPEGEDTAQPPEAAPAPPVDIAELVRKTVREVLDRTQESRTQAPPPKQVQPIEAFVAEYDAETARLQKEADDLEAEAERIQFDRPARATANTLKADNLREAAEQRTKNRTAQVQQAAQQAQQAAVMQAENNVVAQARGWMQSFEQRNNVSIGHLQEAVKDIIRRGWGQHAFFTEVSKPADIIQRITEYANRFGILIGSTEPAKPTAGMTDSRPRGDGIGTSAKTTPRGAAPAPTGAPKLKYSPDAVAQLKSYGATDEMIRDAEMSGTNLFQL